MNLATQGVAKLIARSQDDDHISCYRDWLPSVIETSHLMLDVLIVLDCYMNVFSEGGVGELITILDSGSLRTRYGIIGAGYLHS